MDDNYEILKRFFSDLGFSITRNERTGSFGDYIIEGCSSSFCVKGTSDRSFESIEIRSLNDPKEWFILNVVMTLVLQERKLIHETSLEEQMGFLENRLDDIALLFAEDNYEDTKIRLKDLVKYRGKILFPRWFE